MWGGRKYQDCQAWASVSELAGFLVGKKSQVALCGQEQYTYAIVLDVLESEEKL